MNTSLHSASPSESVAQFFNAYPVYTYEKGEVLIQAQTMPKAYYIVKGVIAQYDISEAGDKLVVNLYKAGSFIPLASILNTIPTEFFFEASTTVTVQEAPLNATAQFLKDTPSVVYDALARVSRGSNGLFHRLSRVMEGGAEGRILQELIIMNQRFSETPNIIHTTEAQLAVQTGLARETVNRAIQRLRKKKILKSARGCIELL